ncbi:MAG: chemotaxis protein CheA [Armatimonadetes bacterium]|nr:chemotaxis protein CheA [Armatimonadota bacterium]
MSAELDMSQYLGLFLQEAEEQLEVLEQETLKLEADPTETRLQAIFRAAHTLKGSSRAMGFSRLAELTHEMENLLDKLRNKELSVDRAIADALLECQDALRTILENIAAGNGDECDCSTLVATLQGFAPGTSGQSPPSANASGVPEADYESIEEAAKQQAVHHARFRLKPECVMKYVRAFMAVNLVQEQGEVLVTVPNHEKLEEEDFELDFELVFQFHGDVDELSGKFAEISEIDSVSVGPWARPEQAAAVVQTPAEVAVESVESPTAAAPVPGKKGEAGQTVRVDVSRLDALMNLVGELVIDRTRIAQVARELQNNGQNENVEALVEAVSHIARITGDLQDQIMKTRMLPIETVFNRFPRVVRDLAKKLGKDVRLDLVGGDTELDRSVIEAIGDPLLHIIRNSIDHGLEMPDERVAAGKSATGVVTVSARHQENHIVIEIEDDGKGIDLERVRAKAVENGLTTVDAASRLSDRDCLQFIFASGVSTAQEVSEVSGRGVGMDIVRSNVQRLGGVIELDTVPGKGTKFSLRLPLTLAIIRGLLVGDGGVVYVLPLGSVVETMRLEPKEVKKVSKDEAIVIRGSTMPLVRLDRALASKKGRGPKDGQSLHVVIVSLAEKRLGLVVEELIGDQEVVIKSLSRFCGDVPGISGATILGDGSVALILDVNGLVPKERMEPAWH